MKDEKEELIKLSRALRKSGRIKHSNAVLKLAFSDSSSISLFKEVWDQTEASKYAAEAKAAPSKAFFDSLYHESGFAMGTQEGLMLASLLYGPKEGEVHSHLEGAWQSQSTSVLSDAAKYVGGLVGANTGAGIGSTLGAGAAGLAGGTAGTAATPAGTAAGGITGAGVGGTLGGLAGGAAGYYGGASVGEWLGNTISGGKNYTEATIKEIVEAELSGNELKAAMMILNGEITLQNFDPDTGEFKSVAYDGSGGGDMFDPSILGGRTYTPTVDPAIGAAGFAAYMSIGDFETKFWTANSPEANQIVGIKKDAVGADDEIFFLDLDKPAAIDQYFAAPISDREALPQYLTDKEKKELLRSIKKNVNRRDFVNYKLMLKIEDTENEGDFGPNKRSRKLDRLTRRLDKRQERQERREEREARREARKARR